MENKMTGWIEKISHYFGEENDAKEGLQQEMGNGFAQRAKKSAQKRRHSSARNGRAPARRH